MTTGYEPTEHDLELAYKAGQAHARASILMELPGDTAIMVMPEDIHDLVYQVAGVKIANVVESNGAYELADRYGDGYWDTYLEAAKSEDND